MKGWKRWKRGFGRRKTTASAISHHTAKQSVVVQGSLGSGGSIANSERKSKHAPQGRHHSIRKKSTVSHKKSHLAATSGRTTTRPTSRSISRSQSSSEFQEEPESTKAAAVTFQKNLLIVRTSYGADGRPMVCDANHEGRTVLRERFHLPIDVLFNMLFGNSSTFLRKFHEKRQSTNLNMGEWITSTSGERERTVKVTVALQGNVGPKTSNVTEYQTLRKCSQPGRLYSIDVNSMNAGIPYADAFCVDMHFCMTSTADHHHTDIEIFAQVKFVKSVWAVIKVFIEKNTYAGLEEFFQSLQKELHLNVQKSKKS